MVASYVNLEMHGLMNEDGASLMDIIRASPGLAALLSEMEDQVQVSSSVDHVSWRQSFDHISDGISAGA